MDELQRRHVEMTVTLLGGGDNIVRDLASIPFLNNTRRVSRQAHSQARGTISAYVEFWHFAQ